MFSHYLLDSTPPKEFVERYINANHALKVMNVVNKSDVKILEYARNHPWSIPFLDAASGILQPNTSLRKKIYIMAAVIEASPKYAEDFLPQNLSPLRLFTQLVINGFTGVIKVIFGIPLFLFFRAMEPLFDKPFLCTSHLIIAHIKE